ncbi:GNAT family N-acetyltransferase [Fodinicola feengrottensis]|uniref:GNAT family N-acetyltransferase n=1 Tax=Fodinicola feengrottensis TaxID=435914 RepID=A0ABN2H487_9ACTN
MLTRQRASVLTGTDLPAARSLLDRDPVASAVVAAKLTGSGLAEQHLGAQLWGSWRGRQLRAVCLSSGNLVPVGTDAADIKAFADRALMQGRICSSMLGEAEGVLELWNALRPYWGPAREVRSCQPLLATSELASVRADPAVRLAEPADLPLVLPACVAMYHEEVGVSPLGRDGGAHYRGRVAGAVAGHRMYVRVENGAVIFKAELGAVTPDCCQVQGVWVHPDHRGEGLASAGMAAVIAHALRRVAPVVSLYVNDYNQAARRVYARCGFHQVGTFASVLF